MPNSSILCKEYLRGWFRSMPKNIRFLDVGPGQGTYSDLLHECGFNAYHMDAVEIFTPYIEQFNLKKKYSNVFNEDIVSFTQKMSTRYDVVIMGDVLEHLSESEARIVIDNLKKENGAIIISVPYHNQQGIVNDNIFETHLQPELDEVKFKELYPEFVCVRTEANLVSDSSNLNVYGQATEIIAIWVWKK